MSQRTPAISARAMTARTPDQEAIRAAESFDAIPPLPRFDPDSPASTLIKGSPSYTSVMRVAELSVRGLDVYKPSISVNKIRTSAFSRCDSSAEIWSLSPKRISSLAIASFSLTTGTQPSSISRSRVSRACKYCVRSTKSCGTSRTCAATKPWLANSAL